MKKYYVLLTILFSTAIFAQFNYQRAWGTYYGGHDFAAFRIKTDHEGNKYIIGNANNYYQEEIPAYYSAFTSPVAQTFNNRMDVILKLSPQGILIWCKYFGLDASSQGRAIDLAFDSANNLYLTGSLYAYDVAGIVTEPIDFDIFSIANKGYIAKFTSSGDQLWGKLVPFVPTQMKVDASDQFYFTGYTEAASGFATAGVFQEVGSAAQSPMIASYDLNGNKLWATYYGSGVGETIALDEFSNIYVTGYTYRSDNFYATPGCFQAQSDFTLPNKRCTFISKFSPTGQRIWSTYYGLYNNIPALENALVNDIAYSNGSLYLVGSTNIATGIATPGSYQTSSTAPYVYANGTVDSNSNDGFLTRFDSNGNRIWGTYFGGDKQDYCASVQVDGNFIFISGITRSMNNIATSGSFQPSHFPNSYDSGFIAQFNINGASKNWGTYYGGQKICTILKTEVSPDHSLYIAGDTQSDDGIATANCLQPARNTGSSSTPAAVYNMMIARFNQIPLSTISHEINDFQLYPNPNTGRFYIKGNVDNRFKNLLVKVTDIQGRDIVSVPVKDASILNEEINLPGVSAGVYFVRMSSADEVLKTVKVIVE